MRDKNTVNNNSVQADSEVSKGCAGRAKLGRVKIVHICVSNKIKANKHGNTRCEEKSNSRCTKTAMHRQ